MAMPCFGSACASCGTSPIPKVAAIAAATGRRNRIEKIIADIRGVPREVDSFRQECQWLRSTSRPSDGPWQRAWQRWYLTGNDANCGASSGHRLAVFHGEAARRDTGTSAPAPKPLRGSMGLFGGRTIFAGMLAGGVVLCGSVLAQDSPAPAPAAAPAAAAPADQGPWTKLCTTDPASKKDFCVVTQEVHADTGQF